MRIASHSPEVKTRNKGFSFLPVLPSFSRSNAAVPTRAKVFSSSGIGGGGVPSGGRYVSLCQIFLVFIVGLWLGWILSPSNGGGSNGSASLGGPSVDGVDSSSSSSSSSMNNDQSVWPAFRAFTASISVPFRSSQAPQVPCPSPPPSMMFISPPPPPSSLVTAAASPATLTRIVLPPLPDLLNENFSRMQCTSAGRRGGGDCIFFNTLFRNGKFWFVVPDGTNLSKSILPANVYISHDLNYDHTPDLIKVTPSPVNFSTVLEWTNGAHGTPPPLTLLPLQTFARLNPENIYHHLWDDMGFAHSLGCKTLERLGATVPCQPGVTPPFALILADRFRKRDVPEWRKYVAEEVLTWAHLQTNVLPGDDKEFSYEREKANEAKKKPHLDIFTPLDLAADIRMAELAVGLYTVPVLAIGSRGACTHRRHCTDIVASAPVRQWQLHLRAMHGVVTQLPLPGENQTAVIVERVGRRRLTNVDEIVDLMGLMGFTPKVIGPFKDMNVTEQFNAFANASLAIFVFGAELGPAWVGLPDGACAAVLHPAQIVESLSYWIADKVGIKVTTMIEIFKKHDDPRLAPDSRVYHHNQQPKTYSDIWLDLFNTDFRIDPKDLWRQTWCTDAPWPPD
jgi:hypothetical protein